MDDFTGNKLNETIDKDFLISEESKLGMGEGYSVDDYIDALGSTFPGDDFLNSFMDLSNFADLQVIIDFRCQILAPKFFVQSSESAS
jgi:hypothetical protein